MNIIFLFLIATAFVTTGYRQLTVSVAEGSPTPMQELTTAMVDSAGGAVELAIGLIGVMTFFLGLMKVAEAGGLLKILAKLIRPLMVRLFPEVPPEHPAMGAMILNIAANVMGLGNAATPFGIRAMQELDRLNPLKGTATNSMVLFLAINTSSVTLLPTGVIGVRAALGSTNPAAILPTTLFATICSTTVAIIAAKLLARRFPLSGTAAAPTTPTPDADPSSTELADATDSYPAWVSYCGLGAVVALIPLTVLFGNAISPWVLPGLAVGMLGFGALRGVRVYEAFVDGAREGFQVAVKIIPYLVAILVAVAMFRVAGGLDLLVGILSPLTAPFGLPAEALPMALLRPLSGSGAFALMTSMLKDPAIGPDSYVGLLVSTIQGSTETTFYVLAVYFGAVQVRNIRHALAAGLLADLAGVIAAVIICSALYVAH